MAKKKQQQSTKQDPQLITKKNRKQVKQLQKEWYQKLSEDGFFDIESETTRGGMKLRNRTVIDPLYYPTKCRKIDAFINDDICIFLLNLDEYRYLDKLRFTGYNRESARAVGISETQGEYFRRKWEKYWDEWYDTWYFEQEETYETSPYLHEKYYIADVVQEFESKVGNLKGQDTNGSGPSF
jgi:hypothetical protein